MILMVQVQFTKSMEIRAFPRPLTHPEAWVASIQGSGWSDVVARVYFTSFCADPCRDRSEECDCLALLPFVCSSCLAALPSRRQLSSHRQRAHNWRKPIGKFIDDSCPCPSCGARVTDRLRVLNHVATRSCGQTILNGRFDFVPAKLLCKLVSRDRKLRLQARHEGQSEAVCRRSPQRSVMSRFG